MPWSKTRWDVDTRIREAGGWIGPLGAPREQEPDMDGAFRELRRMSRVDTRDHDNFDCAREDDRLGFGLYSDDAPGLHGPTTGFQDVTGPTLPPVAATASGATSSPAPGAVAPSSDRAAAAGFRDDS